MTFFSVLATVWTENTTRYKFDKIKVGVVFKGMRNIFNLNRGNV